MSKETRHGLPNVGRPFSASATEIYTLVQVKTYHYGYDESTLADGWTPYHNPPIDT